MKKNKKTAHRPPAGNHVSEQLVDLFMQLRDPDCPQFSLMSCFVNGKPSVAIVAASPHFDKDWKSTVLKFEEDGEHWYFYTLFVLPTPDMLVSYDESGSA